MVSEITNTAQKTVNIITKITIGVRIITNDHVQ